MTLKTLSVKKKFTLNTITSLLLQLLTFVSGFILPRLYLLRFGSEINGLVSSITTFLGFITLAECGVGAVVQTSFYRPINEHDDILTSKIFVSSERFFKKIAYLLIAYIGLLIIFYPRLVAINYEFLFTASLILAMAISTFAQYFFGMTYKLYLNAQQFGFIQYGVSIICLVVNTTVTVILLQSNCSIQFVKLASSLIMLAQPFVFRWYVTRNFSINRKVILDEEPIKQKWNGLAQHIAFIVASETDTVVLSLFSSLSSISIYHVYYMIVNGLRQVIVSLTNGTTAYMGNCYAKKDKKALEEFFSCFEWAIHYGVTTLFTICGILLVPFIMIYTRNIEDANYYVPLFSALLTISQGIKCIQLPYNSVIHATGRFKETQWGSIWEAAINIAVSVIFVLKYGIVGVAIGTIVAFLYRTCYLSWYLSRHITHRKITHFIGHAIVDVVLSVLSCFICSFLPISPTSYVEWLFWAIIVGLICVVLSTLINCIIYKNDVGYFLSNVVSKKIKTKQGV